MWTRKNVWTLDGEWPDELRWYARGVGALQSRQLADPTGWRFLAAIHGFDPRWWSAVGAYHPTDRLPDTGTIATFWNQCQHGSWYFLPWHRGYLWAFEQTVRAAVVSQGGPEDWSLPYWNYFADDEQALPPAFAARTTPDGATNPLFVEARYGPDGDGHVEVPLRDVTLRALLEQDFTGVSGGGNPGFGGVDTGFSHSGQVHGQLETQPHDMVHVLVGGSRGNDRRFPGEMSVPVTAGLDPIFWLHHANVDRLWETWRRSAPWHVDPVELDWLDGPPRTGGRAFAFPLPDGSTWTPVPRDVVDLGTLGYTYDSFAPAIAAPAMPRPSTVRGETAMPGPDVELVGANDAPLQVGRDSVTTHVRLDPQMRRKVSDSRPVPGDGFAGLGEGAGDRVLLNLEGVRGSADATVLDVLVSPPAGTGDDGVELHAGTLALFGLESASDPDGEHAGSGQVHVLDISQSVGELERAGAFDVEHLVVRIVPRTAPADDLTVTVDRVSVFRQGA